ncbi:hypothetical protein KKB40_02015 [Patescibacteria group bacterium]|nr:hypothetical protein [Patescibacteria group bacterium]
MTEIPGTQKLSFEKQVEENRSTKPLPTSVVNIAEMKKDKKEESQPEDRFWYNQAYVWIFGGMVISLFFVLLSFSDKRFLFLTPTGPIAGLFSWYVRKTVKRFEKMDITDEL